MGWLIIEISIPGGDEDGFFELRNVTNKLIKKQVGKDLLKSGHWVTSNQHAHSIFAKYCEDVEYGLHHHVDYPFRVVKFLSGQTNQLLDWIFSFLSLDWDNRPKLSRVFSLLEKPQEDIDVAMVKIFESIQKLTGMNFDEDIEKYNLMVSAIYEIQKSFAEDE